MSSNDTSAQQAASDRGQAPPPSPPNLGDLVASLLDEAAKSGGLGEAILDEENRQRLLEQLRPRFADQFKDLFLMIPWMAFAFSWISGIVMGLMVQVVVHNVVHVHAPVTWMWVLITILVALVLITDASGFGIGELWEG